MAEVPAELDHPDAIIRFSHGAQKREGLVFTAIVHVHKLVTRVRNRFQRGGGAFVERLQSDGLVEDRHDHRDKEFPVHVAS